MFKKNIFNKIGKFDEHLQQVLDIEFGYRALRKCTIGVIGRPLVSFRLHEGQTTAKNIQKGRNEGRELDAFIAKKLFWYANCTVKKEILIKQYQVHFYFLKNYKKRIKRFCNFR